GDPAGGLEQTADGGFILAGSSDSPASGNKTSPNINSEDYWVLRLDASGNKLWEQAFSGGDHDWLFNLRVTSDGGFILGGNSRASRFGAFSFDYWLVRLDAYGNKLWDGAYGG